MFWKQFLSDDSALSINMKSTICTKHLGCQSYRYLKFDLNSTVSTREKLKLLYFDGTDMSTSH